MSLPDIDIPITLPFDLPVLLHPAIVHFAVVLPILVLFLEAANLFMKRRSVSFISTGFLTLLVIVLLGAFFTGKVDGKNAIEIMSPEAKEVLKEHRLLGTYLVYGSLVLLLLKALNLTKLGFLRVIYLLGLAGFIAATLHQGKEGGELVYEHGTNNKAVQALDDKVFELEEQIDTLKSELSELKPTLPTVPTPVEVSKPEEAGATESTDANKSAE